MGQLALAQSRAWRGGFLFFIGGGSSTYFVHADENRISEISYCGYHASIPCGGSACCEPVGVYCAAGLRFSDRLQTYVWGAASSWWASQRPMLAKGHSVRSGRGSLEVSMCGAAPSSGWRTRKCSCRHDSCHLLPRKPSSDAPSPVHRLAGPERPCYTKNDSWKTSYIYTTNRA